MVGRGCPNRHIENVMQPTFKQIKHTQKIIPSILLKNCNWMGLHKPHQLNANPTSEEIFFFMFNGLYSDSKWSTKPISTHLWWNYSIRLWQGRSSCMNFLKENWSPQVSELITIQRSYSRPLEPPHFSYLNSNHICKAAQMIHFIYKH